MLCFLSKNALDQTHSSFYLPTYSMDGTAQYVYQHLNKIGQNPEQNTPKHMKETQNYHS